MRKSGRLENTMKRPDSIRWVLFLSLAALCCCVVLISAQPVSGANRNATVSKSGKHNLNLRTKVQGGFRQEIVRGQITKIMPDGIVMDGEFFSIQGARLQDDHEAELLYSDIYVGLAASVIYTGGRIEKIIVHNLKRPMAIKDKRYIEQERAKSLRGR